MHSLCSFLCWFQRLQELPWPKTSQAAECFHVKFQKLHDSGPDALSFGSASTKVALPNLRKGLVSISKNLGKILWESENPYLDLLLAFNFSLNWKISLWSFRAKKTFSGKKPNSGKKNKFCSNLIYQTCHALSDFQVPSTRPAVHQKWSLHERLIFQFRLTLINLIRAKRRSRSNVPSISDVWLNPCVRNSSSKIK